MKNQNVEVVQDRKVQFAEIVSMIQRTRNDETYCDENEKLSPLVRQLSWTNTLIILSRTKIL